MYPVGELSVWDVSGRGCVWSGKCPIGEVSVGNVSGRRSVRRESVCRGCVHRGNVCWGSVRSPVTHLERLILLYLPDPSIMWSSLSYEKLKRYLYYCNTYDHQT